MLSFCLLFILSFIYQDIEITRWIGPGEPTSYSEWITSQSQKGISISEVYHSNFRNDSLVNIIVTSELYPNIVTNLNIYIQDLETEGYSIVVDTVNSTQSISACETIRNHLHSLLNQGLMGVFFIGNTPLAWYQIIDDFGYGPDYYEEFPIDLYYMDLDGTWLDDSVYESATSLAPGKDSIYDIHTGDVSPEIWLGRLYFSTIGDESELVNKYLTRAHLYHQDSLFAVSRGLCFVDDDWEVDAPLFINEMQYAYSLVEGVTHPESTRVSSYRDHLRDNYEWVGVFCHSSPTLHAFTINQGTSSDYMYSTDIPSFVPQGFFYNLYACSNARYIENYNMGCMYIMGTPRGLGSIGSTKTGAMLDFYYFYHPMGTGKSIGRSFQDWFQYIANNGFSIYEKSYHYGMTYLGDPTLTIKPPGCYLTKSTFLISDSTGNNNGRLDPGEYAEFNFYIYNHYAAQLAGDVSVHLICNDPDLNFSNFDFNFGPISPGDSVINPSPCSVEVSANSSIHTTEIILYITDQISGRIFKDTIYAHVGNHPILIVDDDQASSEQHCINCLNDLGYGSEVISRDTFQPDDQYLSYYQAVIWLTGSDTGNTLTSADQTAIENYFQDSGKILIHGQNIAEELQNTAFLQDFLDLNWLGNTANIFHYGIQGDPVGDNAQLVLGTQYSQDILIAGIDPFPCFSYQVNSDSLSMIRKENPGKLIFAGFGFEGVRSGIPGYMGADSLYQRILNYFQVTTGVIENPLLIQPYPEFTLIKTEYHLDNLRFSISIPIDMEIEIKVYNILGSPVKTLYNQVCTAQTLNINWDYSDNNSRNISNGVYFIRINSDHQSLVEKLYIIK
ncbi:MAG: C25 family cysteine peptidase [bacterium]